MSKLQARIILGAVFCIVVLMTYMALKENSGIEDDYKILLQGGGHKHLPVYQQHEPNIPSRTHHGGSEQTRPHLEKIKVAYPLEKVPGLQEVVRGQHNKEIPEKKEMLDHLENNTSRIRNVTSGVFTMPHIDGENIISMTLYGSSARYTLGAIRNAELIKINFPGWKLRIYTETPSTSRYGVIPKHIIASLRALGADFYFMQPGEDFIPPMMWRFLVADDTWVDRFIVRDADSRLTQRDAAAVYAWIQSGKPFTCIRDHPSHAAYAISGGMWGAKPRELRNILRSSWRDLMRGVASNYLDDMNFLNKVIWPRVYRHAYCLDSVSCDRWPSSYPFPVPRYGYEHVGQVVNEHDLGRPIDLQILKSTEENKNCTPPVKSINTGK